MYLTLFLKLNITWNDLILYMPINMWGNKKIYALIAIAKYLIYLMLTNEYHATTSLIRDVYLENK